jgi:hypothetical protein
VEGSGEVDRDGDDSKVAVSKIKIHAELSFKSLIEAAIKFTFERAKWSGEDKAVEDQGAASATGYQGAASATGDRGIACGHGVDSRAKASLGNWIVLSEWEYDKSQGKYNRINVAAKQVDGEIIKADTWYTLKNGEFAEAD